MNANNFFIQSMILIKMFDFFNYFIYYFNINLKINIS